MAGTAAAPALASSSRRSHHLRRRSERHRVRTTDGWSAGGCPRRRVPGIVGVAAHRVVTGSIMPIPSWLSLVLAALLVVLFPLLFGELMLAGLAKLHIGPDAATALMIAIIVGGMINIPVKRFVRHQDVVVYPFAVFGVRGPWRAWQRVRRETVIAVNLGGCVIPTGLAIYQLAYLSAIGRQAVAVTIIAAAVNAAVCYLVARPEPGVGIVMPGLLSPLVAAALASMLAPDQAPPVAFIAGVSGPLIGADLCHLKDLRRIAVGVASIGGAGTFDGIVLSGIVAAYLA